MRGDHLNPPDALAQIMAFSDSSSEATCSVSCSSG